MGRDQFRVPAVRRIAGRIDEQDPERLAADVTGLFVQAILPAAASAGTTGPAAQV